MSVTASSISTSFVKPRKVEQPGRFGEKPYVAIVDEAFEGPHLKWSRRFKLLEEADTRKIRRGDAIDVIETTQRRRAKQFKVALPSRLRAFGARYAVFVAAYIALAMAWCVVMSLT